MKGWSFGKLMAVFGGAFFAIIIITVVVLKASSSPTGKRVSTPNPALQQPQQQSQIDVMSLQLAASQKQAQEALQAQTNSQQQLAVVREEMRRNNQIMMTQFSQITAKQDEMKRRMDLMDAGRATVQIIKPPRKDPAKSPSQIAAANAKPIPESSGYKVQATVGNRAWIKAGDREESLKPGEKLPPVSKPLQIQSVDSSSGLVIMAPAR